MSDTTFTIEKENLNVTTARTFAASPERIWQAMTADDQIPQWWGPAGNATAVEKNDVQVGGSWRFVQTSEGKEYAFSGEYQEVDEPHKLVRTFEYEPIPGHVLTETMTLEPQADGTTLMTATAHYANIDDLEGMVSMGMEGGQRESYDRLAALVE